MTDKQWDDAIENVSVDGLSADEYSNLVYTLTARRLVESLRDPERGGQPGILQAALRFLKDNEVTGLDIPGSASDAIRKELAAHAPFPRLTGTD